MNYLKEKTYMKFIIMYNEYLCMLKREVWASLVLHHNWEQKLGGRDVYRVGEVWDRWEENGIQRGKGSVSRVPWRNGWQRYDIEAGYWLNGLSGKGSTWLE